MVLVTHWAAFPGGWLCPLRKSPAETPQARDKVSAICSVEDGRMNWDEGGEEKKDGKWEVDKRERVGRKEVREKDDQEWDKWGRKKV